MTRLHHIIHTAGLSLLCALFLTSCNGDMAYADLKTVSTDAWYSSDTVLFEPFTPSVGTELVPIVSVRNTDDYPYRNISLLIEYIRQDSIKLPSSKRHPKYKMVDTEIIGRDTATIILYSEDNQHNGTGFVFQTNEAAANPINLDSNKQYRIRISHIMKQNPLSGITDVGIRLENKTDEM